MLTIEKIYEILNDKINLQKQSDLLDLCAKFVDEELYNEYKYLEMDYDLYRNKLEFVKKICQLDEDLQNKYIANINLMLNMNNITSKQMMKMLLSYGVLVNYFGDINKLKINEIEIISLVTGKIVLEDYTYYAGILSNNDVIESIVNSTDNFDCQVDLAYDVMDNQDTLPYDFITADNYTDLVNDALNIIKNKVYTNTKKC